MSATVMVKGKFPVRVKEHRDQVLQRLLEHGGAFVEFTSHSGRAVRVRRTAITSVRKEA